MLPHCLGCPASEAPAVAPEEVVADSCYSGHRSPGSPRPGDGKRRMALPLGDNVWQSLEQQITDFMVQQEESKRVLALIAEEQDSFIADLHSFVKDQAKEQSTWQAKPSSPRQAQAQGDVAEPISMDWDVYSSANDRTLTSSSSPWESGGKESGGKHVHGFRQAVMDTATSRSSQYTNMRDSSFPVVDLSHYNNNNSGRISGTRTVVNVPPIRDGVRPWFSAVVAWLLGWRFFEPIMGFVIALNAANIGWSINRELQHQDTEFQEVLETVFLVIFSVELALRFVVKGLKCLKVLANAFDFILVTVTVITQVIKPLLELWGSAEMVQYLEQLMILRMMRLLRLARAVRLVASMRSLWKLVQGLMHCFTTMVSAMLLILICIYIFACFGAELIAKPFGGDVEVGFIIRSQFSSLPQILLTLFQFISMDSTAAVYVPLIQRSPALAIYFLLLLVVVAIALMNLITALIVEDAISSAHMDEEMQAFYTRQKLKQLTPALRALFRSLDKSGDGLVEIKEVVHSLKQGLSIPKELQEILNPARMVDLFEALDADQSGDLSESEFVEGLSSVALSDVPLETMQTLHLLRTLRKEVRRGQIDTRRSMFRINLHGHRGSIESYANTDEGRGSLSTFGTVQHGHGKRVTVDSNPWEIPPRGSDFEENDDLQRKMPDRSTGVSPWVQGCDEELDAVAEEDPKRCSQRSSADGDDTSAKPGAEPGLLPEGPEELPEQANESPSPRGREKGQMDDTHSSLSV